MTTPSRSTIKPGDTSHGVRPPNPTPQSPHQEQPGEIINDFLSREGETTKPKFDYSQEFRHGHWQPFRTRVEQALRAIPAVSPRRTAAFCSCGCDAWVAARIINFALPSVKEYKVLSTKCHDRFCVPCSQERSYRIRQSLLKHMKPLTNLKLITLTIKASDDELSTILDRLTKHFRALRSRPIWKKNVKGGVSIIETKLGKNSGKWHCHFHVIAEAKYMHQSQLADEWERITKDSRVVDIRPVGARTGAVSYITKYITKAADHSIVMSPTHLTEAIVAFTGRRMVTTFGSWRGLELMEKPDERQFPLEDGAPLGETQFSPVGPLDAFVTAAAAGDKAAAFILWKIGGSRGRPPPKL